MSTNPSHIPIEGAASGSQEFGESERTVRSYTHHRDNLITDTREQLETPEGAIIHLCPAGISARAQAFLIDELIKIALLVILTLVVALIPTADIGMLLSLLGAFALNWFYGVAFEIFNDGRTPGKNVANLKVVNSDGTPIRLAPSLLRNLLRFLDVMLFCVPALVSMSMSKGFKRIGDHVADTVVIYTDVGIKRKAPKDAVGAAFPVKLNRSEQSAITDFQDRVSSLSGPRSQELAEILEPIHGSTGDDAVRAVLKYANGIRGNL
ncbi:MAG: RDD family protein [Gammaproteobacteria bacterium]|nr:RDD family protein [Gammaproteobacteria bacterium]